MEYMIDIETLATRNDAAIISIGACKFDLGTGMVSDPFLVSIEATSYEYNGLEPEFYVDPETQAWWGKQGQEAKDALTINLVPSIYIALDRMNEWFEDSGFKKQYKHGGDRVWANPPQFDLSILRHAASKVYGRDNDVPWHYRQECDMRTLCHLNCTVDTYDLPKSCDGLVKHRADHDAIRQAYVVDKILGSTK